jgi:hypothetical protein
MGVVGVAASAVVGLGVVLSHGPAVAMPGASPGVIAPHVHRLEADWGLLEGRNSDVFCCPEESRAAPVAARWAGGCMSR